jgi:hypothetical protein
MQLGGPLWKVKLGRRDSKTASFNDASSGVIPSPFATLSDLINRFKAQGLSTKDMVALSGTCLFPITHFSSIFHYYNTILVLFFILKDDTFGELGCDV